MTNKINDTVITATTTNRSVELHSDATLPAP